MSEVLLIGVGHPDRGDDAVGPAVVRALRDRCPAGVRALAAGGDLLALLDRWAGARAAIVVDAIRSGGPPGRIVRLAGALEELELPAFVSSHALDLASVIAVARTLGQLPRELVVYGIEGVRFGTGESMSAEVLAAVPRAAELIVGELARRAADAAPATASARSRWQPG